MKLKPIGSLLPQGKQEFRMIERQIFRRRPKPAEWVILPPPRYSILVARMCHLCESIEIFPNTIQFELHLSRLHSAPFSCPYCPENFELNISESKSYNEDISHDESLKFMDIEPEVKLEIGENLTPERNLTKQTFPCSNCRRNYFSEINLKIHQESCFNGKSLLECQHCFRIVNDRNLYRNRNLAETLGETETNVQIISNWKSQK